MRFRIARLAVLGTGLIAMVAIVMSSLNRNAYFFYRHQDLAHWQHPTGEVAFVAVAVLLETLAVYAVLAVRRPGRLWMRALAALALLVPWGWWVSEFVVHAPGFWLLHIVWVWLISATVAIAAVVSGGAHAYSLFRERFLASL